MDVARYGQAFKDRVVARVLPPESAAVDVVAREIGVTPGTLQRWREAAQAKPARGRVWTAGTLQRWREAAQAKPARRRVWTAGSRLEAVITTAALDDAGRSAWCRAHGTYPVELATWRASATAALAAPDEARASPQATRQDRKRIKELERELLRKDRALAETAALLVLSKKVAAIFHTGEGE